MACYTPTKQMRSVQSGGYDMGRTPFKADLRQLPFRAILALVSRCARRIAPLLGRDVGEDARQAFEAAISASEEYAAGAIGVSDESATAFDLGRLYVDTQGIVLTIAALAAQAASHASGISIFQGPMVMENPFLGESVSPSLVEEALNSASEVLVFYRTIIPEIEAQASNDPSWIDYEALIAAKLGTFPDPGAAVDPSETGPLGSLWPNGPPDWLQ
jgi:hypothetical protein